MFIVKADGYQGSRECGPYHTIEEAKAVFNDMVTAFEEGLAKDDLPETIDMNPTDYYTEWADGEWFSVTITE